MTESFFERHARVQRRLTAGRAGKPEFNIHVDITQPVLEEPSLPYEVAPLFAPAIPVGPDQVVRPTVTKIAVRPRVRDWLSLVRELAGEKSIDVRNLWVRIDVRPENKCMTFTTNLSSLVLAYRDPAPVAGSLRMFIRFAEFAKVVEVEGVSEFSVEGRKLSYVAAGTAKAIDALDRVDGDEWTPDAPPLTGYKLVKELGTALREASFFTKKTPDSMGRHKVLLFPRRDSTGTVDVIACGGTLREEEPGIALIYRREIQAPDLKSNLYLDPLRPLANEKVLPDTLGIALSGADFVWLLTEAGLIIGMSSVPCATPEGVDEALAAPNGRVDLSIEELAALRRAVSQIRINPETVTEKEVALRPRGQARVLEFGTKDNIQSVSCSGDMGPEHLAVNPDLLLHALSVRGLHAIEFDKEDDKRAELDRRPVLLVGPGVRVGLLPIRHADSILR
jgi:hypothetical protein